MSQALSTWALHQLEIEKSGLAGRLRSLHGIIQTRFPLISRMALALYDPVSDALKTFASSNEDGEALQRYEAVLADVPSLLQLKTERRARVVHDIEVSFAHPTAHTAWLRGQLYRSSYTLPIFSGHELAAFLFFDAKEPEVFSTEVTAFLDILADIVSQLYLLRLAAVNTLVGAVDIATGLARIRDVETGRHLERMAAYARLIAKALAPSHGLSDEQVEYVHLFAPLHDIGKVGIPDRILLKPGRLDAEEFAHMKRHVQIGLELVEHILADLSLQDDPMARIMREVVGGHHERGDGSGYPLGLRLAEIPLVARIVAVADVYDALSTERPYKPRWSEADCLAELRREVAAGRLDGDCVEALVAAEAARADIRRRLAD
ncbi:HD domain-containing protein [Paucibacter sp. DJ1R-11]|uniref:HD-GYP domain-containing protein n=1 Tax=Paucibacter sp. DJ1R-11 TaxID=2893556 RepID=UPI0021E3A1F1|nr:HD domain-containing phosphohydrolase [Paucibacter sp. DJ1R-11]MCV2362917.1 HD domain-containing protein [Paucibacter sp. DJ1R-11]